jgi:hypothetical protein
VRIVHGSLEERLGDLPNVRRLDESLVTEPAEVEVVGAVAIVEIGLLVILSG